MKLITATFIAISGLSLGAAPLALAQTSASHNSEVETKIKAVEDSWAAAQLQKDHGAGVIDGLLANDYAGVGSKGEMRDKAKQMEHIRADTDTYSYSKNDSMTVHAYGPDLATVCGTSTEKGKDKDGKEFNRSYAWVDTWTQRNGKWQCIASGGTPLAATP